MIKTTRAAALKALIPPQRIALSDWIEENLVLPEGGTALPGKMRLYPYQKGMADAMSDPRYERVTIRKSARIGFTSLAVGMLGSHIVNDPAPTLFVLPTEDDAKTFVKQNMEPTFEATPALAGALVSDKVGGRDRNTMLSKRFPGGSLKIVAAKAPRNLRGLNIRVLFLDEVDGMEITAEGNPIRLAEMRTQQFDDRKIILGSTPVYESTSLILAEYEKSDKRIYEVPCPHCEGFHEIMWPDIHWPEGEPEKAAWFCPSCGAETDEAHKASMVAKGRWRATQPDVQGHAGFRINSLVSPLANASWGKLAVEFVAAKDNPADLQAFINLALGQGWKEHGDEIDENVVAATAEPFGLEADADRDIEGIPEDVLAITVGVDVQRKDRLEATFVGWDENGAAYILGHRVIWGLPSDDATWRELDELLLQKWQHPLGGSIGIDAVAVDSGDGETMELVYDFCRPRFGRKVYAIKGMAGRRQPWVKSSSKSNNGRLWIVGVDGLKSTIFTRVTRSRLIRFSQTLEPVWFQQFASERNVLRRQNGRPVRQWERIAGRAAEALDCVVYAFACFEAVNVNWAARREQLANPSLEIKRTPKRPKQSYLERIRGR